MSPVHLNDLQASILERLGLDPHLMELTLNGRPVRLIEKDSKPVRAILG